MRMAIADLHVKCALQVRNFGAPGFAQSDCCGRPAVSGVDMRNGSVMWRCESHEGIRVLETGFIQYTVEMQVVQ